MKNKIFGSVCFVIGLIIIVTTGSTFAYFSSNISTADGNIQGNTADFDIDLEVTTIYDADELVPIDSNLIGVAISKEDNKCIDSNGYDVCSLYDVTLSNNGDPFVLNSYVKTLSSTFITDNLKCQLFSSNYVPISDVMTLSNVVDDKLYFENDESSISIQINNTDINYYLAIWIEETNDYQNDDYLKEFSGVIGFETLNGGEVTAEFSS